MSWLDQVRNDMIIVTGDGREFRPLWKDPEKLIEYNYAQFEFPQVKGSLVPRGTPKGRKFPMELYFTGESHLDQAEAFEISAEDSRHWVMTHPYYGVLNVQPTSIRVDHSMANVSKLTINVIETIVVENPRVTIDPRNKIPADVETLATQFERSFQVIVPSPTTLDKVLMGDHVNKLYSEGKKFIINDLDASQYFDFFKQANAAILDATEEPLNAMRAIQSIVIAPSQWADSVKNRINIVVRQFDLLRTTFDNLLPKRSHKTIYEQSLGGLISTMAQASVTAIDYQSAEEVLSVIESIQDTYDQYIEDIDALQTDTGASIDPESYIPDAVVQRQLRDLINFTCSNLYLIALDGKQERRIILEDDSNVIMLAHRFYPLVPDDSSIEYFIKTNNLGLNDMLGIKKGREIIYYA